MKDLKEAYKTIETDHFAPQMEISFIDGANRQTFRYEKVTWKIAGEEKGLRYGENPGQEAALYRLVNGNLALGDVELVQPGPFRTGMTAAILRSFQESTRPGSPFAAMASVMGEMAAGQDDSASDPAVLAEAVWAAGTARRPRHRYAVKWDLARRLLDHLPVPLVDRALRLALARKIDARKLELRREAAEARIAMSEVAE